jgi:hypothetical protein
MKCPWCDGAGGETDVILDDGSGPWEICGLCNGTGKVSLYTYLLGHYYNIESWLKFPHSRKMAKYWFSGFLCLFGLHTWYKFNYQENYKCYVCGKEVDNVYKVKFPDWFKPEYVSDPCKGCLPKDTGCKNCKDNKNPF